MKSQKLGRALIVLLLAFSLPGSAGAQSIPTSDLQVTWNIVDYTGSSVGLTRVSIIPIGQAMSLNSSILKPNPINVSVAELNSLTNGTFTTNLVAGFAYSVTFSDYNLSAPLVITNFFGTNLAGTTVNGANYIGIPISWQGSAITQFAYTSANITNVSISQGGGGSSSNTIYWNGLTTNQLLGVTSPNTYHLTMLDVNSNLNYSSLLYTPANSGVSLLGADGATPVMGFNTNGNQTAIGGISANTATITNGLTDLSAKVAVAPVNRQLIDSGTFTSINWQSRILDDVNGYTAVDYSGRNLYGGITGSSLALNWATAGSLVVPTSTTIYGNGAGVSNVIGASATYSTNGIITTNDLSITRLVPNYNGYQKPLLGFESWVLTQGDANGTFNQQGLLGVMTNMINYGYVAAGYNSFLIDEGWSTNRDGSGNALSSGAFPNGIPWFVSNLHSNGLKAGLFFTLGQSGYANTIGSANYLIQDATNAASYGIDFVFIVVDDNAAGFSPVNGYCQNYWRYKTFISALQSTGKKILVYGTTHTWEPWIQQGMDASFYAGYAGYADYDQTWPTYLSFVDGFPQTRNFCQPGHYPFYGWASYGFDGAGNNNTNATAALYGMLAMWHSPIFIANVYATVGTSFFNSVAAIQTNALMLSIDQDAMANPPQLVASNNYVETWYEQLSGGQYAIGLLNRDTNAAAHNVSISWTNGATFAANPLPIGQAYILQDVFNATNSLVTTNGLSYSMGSNTMGLFILTPTNTSQFGLGVVSNSMASGSNILAGSVLTANVTKPAGSGTPFAYSMELNDGANHYLYYTAPGTLGAQVTGGTFVCLDSTASVYEPLDFWANGVGVVGNGGLFVYPQPGAFTNAFQVTSSNGVPGVFTDFNGTNLTVRGNLIVSNSIGGAGFTNSVNAQVTNDCVQPSTITISQTAGPIVMTNGSTFNISYNGGALTNLVIETLNTNWAYFSRSYTNLNAYDIVAQITNNCHVQLFSLQNLTTNTIGPLFNTQSNQQFIVHYLMAITNDGGGFWYAK